MTLLALVAIFVLVILTPFSDAKLTRMQHGAYDKYNVPGNSSHENSTVEHDRTHPRIRRDTPLPSQAKPQSILKFPMMNYMDVCYYVNLTIGDQFFNLLFDTGSSDLWVPDVLEKGKGRNTGNFYDRALSADYKLVQKGPLSITYGSGNVKGDLVNDMITLGNSLSVMNMTFLSASSVTANFDTTMFDGILGASFPGLGLAKETFFQLLYWSPSTNYSSFGVHLAYGNLNSRAPSAGSSLTLGGFDVDNCKMQKVYHIPVISGPTGFDYWRVEVDRISYNGTSLPLTLAPKATSSQAAVDTGTTSLLLPTDAFNALKAQIQQVDSKAHVDKVSGFFFITCGTQLADINVVMSGKSFIIPANDYVNKEAGQCFLAIGTLEPLRGLNIILGTTFLRPYCQLYDLDGMTMSFAASRTKPPAVTAA